MNDTKWEEIRLAMYGLGELIPKWRTRDRETGFESPWDGEWFYHFRSGGYATIEWLEIEVSYDAQRTLVLEALHAIQVPGEDMGHVLRIYGYVPSGTEVEYL
ncbi:MAG: hypothetical protein CVV27_19990 [Candidatus Melainabacteria bacterium HGW-Melainabacteria-1]|nr:MAG: hypothetical protein CVV27_19990 [Candidatus Melainabacteria bacterium HGW-Melainabacteria-1]